MIKKILTILFIIPVLWACNNSSDANNDGEKETEPEFRVVGYLPDYRIESIDVSVADQLTDVIYFSIEPYPYGSLDLSRLTSDTYFRINALKNRNPNLKIHIAVGGWGRSEHFGKMSTDSIARAKFISNLSDLCLTAGFSGADYDWEFPANSTENDAYGVLIAETRAEFDKNDLKISVALNVNQKLSSSAYDALHRINIMSYDHGAYHSTYDQSVLDVNNFLNRGISPDNLCLGVPFYGREIENFSNEISYRGIVSIYNPGPDEDIVDGFFYNGPTTVQRKTNFAMQQKLQGVMIWEIGQDATGDKSLLSAINSQITD
jgi:chitinase